ncbi:hypothetical protein [Actinomadura rayongensis]|uniref:Uncharacterized protein n=1 Tax=Actinomadura rayongensis TaxID=1429076 RepID=A0A6I4WB71_9ACTN|nr:hypothetical protein [Actinomadura rayongensis]MXQ66918.1 hypothetical protein [Actinomadura rayongensis]
MVPLKNVEDVAIKLGSGPIGRFINMSARRRSRFIVWGAGLAIAAMLFPDLYEIDYQGPPLRHVRLDGVTGNFNAVNGPFDGTPMLGAFVFVFVVGVLTRWMDFTVAWRHLSRGMKVLNGGHHVALVAANVVGLVTFFSQFNNGGLPDAVTAEFARRAGAAKATTYSDYLYPSFGMCVFLLAVGVAVGLIGVLPLFFAIVEAAVVGFVVLVVVAAGIGVPVPGIHSIVDVGTYDGRRPTYSDACVLKPPHDENCASTNPKVAVQVPNPAQSTVGCSYSVTIDWGDRTPAKTVAVHGTAGKTLLAARHTYRARDGAWRLNVRERLTSGHCPSGRAAWRPEFALGVEQSSLHG